MMNTEATSSTSSLKAEVAVLSEDDSKVIGANSSAHSKKSSSTVKSSRPVVKPPHMRLAYVPGPPADAEFINRFYFYGWYVDFKWLSELAHKMRVQPISSPPHYANDGIRFLRHAIGYRPLKLVDCLVEGNESYEDSSPGKYPGEQAISVLAICVNARHLVRMRPTQHQLDQYIRIFKREPRWFKGAGELSDFGDYEYPKPITVPARKRKRV